MNGIRMPAEWEPHRGTIMIWPERPGSWPYAAQQVRPLFAQMVSRISVGERVYLAVSERGEKSARELLKPEITSNKVELWRVDTDDCWARDTGPTFVKENGVTRGVDWAFNAWGGGFDGLYKNYLNDDAFAAFACRQLGLGRTDAHPFVLEGGSVHSDGAGNVVTTEECLLSKGRNPSLTRTQIEKNLKNFLGADRVVWLKRGVVGDETNGHVDNICALAPGNTAILAWSDSGEQGEVCRENYKILKETGYNVLKMPLPSRPVTVSKEDLSGFEFEEGEAVRTVGERLAASYVNFYVCNAGVLVPQFGDVNDKTAVAVLKKVYPEKKIIPIPAQKLIVGGGNIHCLTQQIPL